MTFKRLSKIKLMAPSYVRLQNNTANTCDKTTSCQKTNKKQEKNKEGKRNKYNYECYNYECTISVLIK